MPELVRDHKDFVECISCSIISALQCKATGPKACGIPRPRGTSHSGITGTDALVWEGHECNDTTCSHFTQMYSGVETSNQLHSDPKNSHPMPSQFFRNEAF